MRLERVNKNRIINKILAVFSFFCSFYVLNNTTSHSGYEWYFLVPLFFGVILLFCRHINFIEYEWIGPFLINITMMIKYCILPFIACMGSYASFSGVSPYASDINTAVFLTLYEMVVIVLFSNYLSRKFHKMNLKSDFTIYPIKRYFVHLAIIATGIIVVVLIPQTISNYKFIFDTSNLRETIQVDFAYSGIFKNLVIFARYSAVLLIISICYKKYQKHKSNIFILISIFAILINSLYVINLSRFSLICPLLAFTILILLLYDKKQEKKIIFCILGGTIVAGILFMSFYKFFGQGRGTIDNSNNIQWWADTLQKYFTGVKETAVGVNAMPTIESEYSWFRLELLFNDLFNNVIGLSNMTNVSINSTTLFNFVYFGSSISVSQIVPNICEGMYYFGTFFAPYWMCIFVYLAYFFTYKIYHESSIDKKFALIYACVYCGLILMINYSMIVANIINMSLFFYIISVINKGINKR